MKLTKKLLAENKIHNSHNLMAAAKSKMYIFYHPQELGRGGTPASWQVVGNNFKTDPKAAWYDNGCKSFMVWGRTDKQAVLQKAMGWAKDTYGITEWERDVFGNYQIKGTLAQIETLVSKVADAKQV